MRRNQLRTWLIVGIILTTIGASALVVLGDDRPELVVAVQKLPATVEPGDQLSNVAVRIHYNMFDKLIDIDFKDSWNLKPGLAVSWERIDGKTVEVKLRQGVKFHNGDIMTAEDVAFTFGPERMTSEGAPVWRGSRPYWANLDRVEIVDDSTVRFIMTVTDPLIEQRIAGLTSDIINKQAFLEAEDFDAWARNPVGTGPYKIAEVKANEYILLEAFDDYWRGAPPAKSVKFVAVPEMATRIAGLASGEYDIITDVGPDQIAEIEARGDLDVVGGPVAGHRLIAFDINNPILADVHLRRAMSLAIDRDIIVETLWDNRTVVPNSMQFPFYGDMYIEDWPLPEYNPAKAQEELALSSYQGEGIEYRVLLDYYAAEVATAQVLVEMWKAVGINVNIVMKENWSQVFDPEGRGIRNWSNFTTVGDPVGALWRLHGVGGYQQVGSKEYFDADFNSLGAVLESSLNTDIRRSVTELMLQIFDWQNPPSIVLHQMALFYGKRAEVDWTPYNWTFMDFRARNLSF